jgi:hypothetical protein
MGAAYGGQDEHTRLRARPLVAAETIDDPYRRTHLRIAAVAYIRVHTRPRSSIYISIIDKQRSTMACKSRVSPATAIIAMVVVLLMATAVAPCHAAVGSGVAVTTTVPASAASPLAQRL